MGRYYTGDIEGKFWFGVQNSNDADFFGQEGTEPNYLDYYFDKTDLPKIESGIAKCKKELGLDKKKLDVFFEENNSYNEEMLTKEFGWPKAMVNEKLEWYARLFLGTLILKCVKRKGECHFTAEL